MKRMYAIMLAAGMLINTPVSAVDLYQALRDQVVRLGSLIENTDNIPLINKLTNVLPFAVAKTCLKECPGQTMMVLGGIFLYILSKNESVRSLVRKYNMFNKYYRSVENQSSQPLFDDTLFIFDGEDSEDAQEEEDTEEDLFEDELDRIRNKQNQKTPVRFI